MSARQAFQNDMLLRSGRIWCRFSSNFLYESAF